MHLLEIISADIVFNFFRYTHIRIIRGWGLRSHHLQRRIQGGQTQPYSLHLLQSARKWHKINTFLDITRKQSNFCVYKIGFYYLLGRRQAKSDYVSEMWYLFKVRPQPLPFWIRHWWPFHLPSIFSYEKRCSSQIKVKTGRQVIRHVEYFKKCPLPFRNGPTSMTITLSLQNIIWYPRAASASCLLLFFTFRISFFTYS